MMIKKQLGVLAGAVLFASASHAAIDLNNAVLFAWDDANDDTYFLDLGIDADTLATGGNSVVINAGGVVDFANNATGSVFWSIVGLTNEQPNGDNGGLVGTATGATDGLAIAGTQLDTQEQNWTNWLSDVNVLLGSATEGLVSGSDPASIDQPRIDGTGFANSAIALNTTALLFNNRPLDGLEFLNGTAETVQVAGSTALLTTQATVVPVPAAAWLFGSALVGLGVVRRK